MAESLRDLRCYSVLIKPIGGRCNLDCSYCYYIDKPALFGSACHVMSDEILELTIRQIFDIHGRDATVSFHWHGGEPLLAGVDFFVRALELQKQYGAGRPILNTLQTNAVLVDDQWARFLKTHDFQVGVSIDGPKYLHDISRLRRDGTGSFDDTMRGITLLQRHEVEFSALCTINAANARNPVEVFHFLTQLTNYIQFLPVVERMPTTFDIEVGQRNAEAPGIYSTFMNHTLQPYSVKPEDFGNFMSAVYGEWAREKNEVHVQLFDVIEEKRLGLPCSLCTHDFVCGHSLVIEANGDVYSCDRYVNADYLRGNIASTHLGELGEKNRDFGMDKAYGLSRECLECPHVKLCMGGCPKDRFVVSGSGYKNYLCEGYKQFFSHVSG